MQFGYTSETEASDQKLLDLFCLAADIAGEEGTGDPARGGYMRRHGRIIDLGRAQAVPEGYPGSCLDPS